MDFYKVPIGFGMALAVNEPAMNAYSKMTEDQKQAILNKAHNVRSEKEMHDLVNSLAHPTIQYCRGDHRSSAKKSKSA